ncbi:hypothetical protein BCR34DRAFT_625800 [Clohesyomyces aquaticus]|uniref:Uncharacterized protein n=1 Tax=Clohesyomyces aquaticus TaxID=1231657 RepID=A0A1Y1ZHA7_9PLEO|nr:hypothetical protein BCR34DRAFT_625800 [Clohesyomyces aquaticus]
MAQTICLAAIFIPTTGEEEVGKLIHVTGNPATGSFLEFKRNYDFRTTSRRHQLLPLAQVEDQYVADTPGAVAQDTTACGRLKSTATVVPPPGRGANPFNPTVFDFVEKLVEDGFVAFNSRTTLQSAPKSYEQLCSQIPFAHCL